jgi:hypothetical protein
MGRDTARRLLVKTRGTLRCVPTVNGDALHEEFVPSTPLRGSSMCVVATEGGGRECRVAAMGSRFISL